MVLVVAEAAVYGPGPASASGGNGSNGTVILKYPTSYDIYVLPYPSNPVSIITSEHPDGLHRVSQFRLGRSNSMNFNWEKVFIREGIIKWEEKMVHLEE